MSDGAIVDDDDDGSSVGRAAAVGDGGVPRATSTRKGLSRLRAEVRLEWPADLAALPLSPP